MTLLNILVFVKAQNNAFCALLWNGVLRLSVSFFDRKEEVVCPKLLKQSTEEGNRHFLSSFLFLCVRALYVSISSMGMTSFDRSQATSISACSLLLN